MGLREDRTAVLTETLAVFDHVDRGAPLTTNEVAADLDCSRRATYDRLERLVDRGDIATKKVGAKARVWWRPAPASADGDGLDTDDSSTRSEDQDLWRLVENVPGMVYRCQTGPGGPMSFVSDGCKTVTGYDPAQLESDEVRWSDDVVHFSDRKRLRNDVPARLERDGQFSVTYRIEAADGEIRWVHDHGRLANGRDEGTRIEGVVTAIGRDETRRQSADKPDHSETVKEVNQDDATIMLDSDGTVTSWNDGAARMLGYDEDEIVGEHVSTFHTKSDRTAGEVAELLAKAASRGTAEETGWGVRNDGSRFPANVTLTAIQNGEEEVLGYASVVRDVSDRQEYEQRLRKRRDELEAELDEVFERIDDAFCAVNDDFRFTYVNEQAEALLQHPEAELLGRTVWETFPEASNSPVWEAFKTALETQEAASFEHYVVPLSFWVEATVYPSETGLSVYFRDISEQKAFEQTLTALHATSRELLATKTKEAVSETVVEAATDVLDLDGVIVYRYDSNRNVFVPDAQSPEADFVRRAFPQVESNADTIGGTVTTDGEARRYDDVCESPLHRDVTEDGEMRAGLFAPMGDHGIVIAGSRYVGSFDDRTQQLLEVLAANAEATYDRVERERKLARQRERLAALDELNAVVRDINKALIEQSTREEIEQVVCERLADAASYECAWICEVGQRGDEVAVRAEAGVETPLEDVLISVAPEHPTSDDPTARAFRTRDMHVATGDADHSIVDPNGELDGYTKAAIPITYEDVLYGVLNVYASRVGAFTDEERAVVGQLGDVVGHAINSVERKRALMSDDVTEVQFRHRNLFGEFGIEAGNDATVTFEQILPISDDVMLIYGTATEEAVEPLLSFEDAVPAIEEVTILGRQFGKVRVELRVLELPVITQIAAQGGDLREARIENGDYYMTFQLPPNVDVREVIETTRANYPPVEMVTRRQVSRSGRTEREVGKAGGSLERAFEQELTDRQRAALLAGYYSGFFDWPRDSSGEDVAESLDVSPSTFHQHVRIAERKLLEAVLDDHTA